jgi:hypothetical protein
MNEKKMFKELVYYIMACRSGSMFNGTLDENGSSKLNLDQCNLVNCAAFLVYVMTAAHPDTDTNPKDALQGTKDGISYIIYINTQFGDAWMDNAEEVRL